jgi:cytochrome c peroxidase
MHNGHYATLREVVLHYSEVDISRMHQAHLYDDDGVPVAIAIDKILKPLKLSEQEVDDLVAFLESLTEKTGPHRSIAKVVACR